ncbi:hypothetical protein L0U85_03810 [Glycomyces sp. L485]|uniref:hypothetical protein n=1 Tax=Glycomyces sp. L485 TaxID=2909235 RepID=UPI001F4B8D57|nr:hypothetical protein [Glycomyces sp. L485]MCH7229988.1 hypothetical protein [Glycomyces sp. L485]
MWTTTAAFSGLIVAALCWRFALTLAPDEHGIPLSTLPRNRWLAAMCAALLGGAAGAAGTAAVWPHQPDVLAFALFAAVSPCLAVIDAVLHRLPFVVAGVLAVAVAIAFGWDALLSGESDALMRAVWAGAAAGAFGLLLWLVFPGKFGFGDVALLSVIGVFAGSLSWAAIWAALFVGFTLAALGAGVARWRAGRTGAHLPLGPFLLAGWWTVFALYAAGWVNQPL